MPLFLLIRQYSEEEKKVGNERGREKEGEREDGQEREVEEEGRGKKRR